MLLRKFHTFQALMREKPTNLKNKKLSSQNWIQRQINDPYVELAKQHNYRCRSAFKLLELNDRFKIFEPGMTVIDCGAAPGSWTQVSSRLVNADGKMFDEIRGHVIAIDKLPMHHVEGAIVYGNMDFTSKKCYEVIKSSLEDKFADIVLSDMAPNASGVKSLDHENIINLAYAALKFAIEVSAYQSSFVVKVWDGRLSPKLEEDIRRFYRSVKIVRPEATREESSEKFILAREFKGLKTMTK